MLRRVVSFVLEAGMFWWTPRARTTGGPLFKSAVFGSFSSLPALIGVGGGLHGLWVGW